MSGQWPNLGMMLLLWYWNTLQVDHELFLLTGCNYSIQFDVMVKAHLKLRFSRILKLLLRLQWYNLPYHVGSTFFHQQVQNWINWNKIHMDELTIVNIFVNALMFALHSRLFYEILKFTYNYLRTYFCTDCSKQLWNTFQNVCSNYEGHNTLWQQMTHCQDSYL